MSTWPTGGSRSEQTTPQLSPTQLYPPMQPPFRNSPREGPANPLVSLPPLRQLSSTPPPERRYGSSFGVHAMLNPQAEITEQQRGRRRSASQMESPSPVETQHSSLQSISRPPSVDSTQDEQRSRQFLPPDRPSTMRHLLSPKSPKGHRTQSLNLLNPPTGTIDAHQSPFLTANTRPSEPVAPHSSLGPSNRPVYFTAQSSDSIPPQAIPRPDVRRPSIGFPQSGSASPIPQYSPYSQPASVASSQYDNQSTHGQYAPSPSHVPLHDSRHGSIPMETERNSMMPMGPGSQSSIQIMTIKSQQGHPVQIPVDVQAASKVADEKRRRNAGASARFRARRKEKEREASMSISRLEQQLRDAIEDAEFYRNERDFFKSLVLSQPNPPNNHYRPSSPRLRRHSVAPSHAPSSTDGPGSDGSYAEYEEEAREEERNVRRRTSNYHPVSGPPPTESNSAGPPHHGYSVPAFPPVNLPPVQSAPHEQYQSHPQSASPAMQPAPMDRPVFPNPFTSEPGRYDHRNWSPSQNEGRPN